MKNLILLFISFHFYTCFSQSTLNDSSFFKNNFLDTSFDNNFMEMSLEELMNINVNTGTVKKTTIRETPGVMTVITADDIKKLGARDLIDVLQLVPGIEFGSDIENYVGIGMRGLWASEGKISLFIDDHEYNELGYATLPFGNHFPIDQISKIEIIRGPGSAIYGGTSQYGVIKITTKAHELNGVQASVYTGKMDDNFSSAKSPFLQRTNYFIQAGKKRKDYSMYLNTFLGKSQRSIGNFTDYYTQNQVSFRNQSALENQSIMASGSYKKLQTSFLYDWYSNQGPDYYGTTYTPAMNTYYGTFSGNLIYEAKLSNNITIKPQFYYRNQRPWISADTISTFYINDRRIQRNTARLDFIYDTKSKFNLLAGIQGYNDNGSVVKDRFISNAPDSVYSKFYDGKSNVQYFNLSIYAQGNYTSRFVNITFGGRYDKHSLGFDAFVPRIGLTKAFDKIHFKFLASQSFRTPYVLNYTSNSIKAEKATFLELETGIKLGEKLFVIANVYDITVKNLLYYQNDGYLGSYVNANETNGTQGAEIELKYLNKMLSLSANYSYYNASSKQNMTNLRVDPTAIENDHSGKSYRNYLLGFSPHKVSFVANYKIKNRFNINLNGNLFGKRFGYDHAKVIQEQTDSTDIVYKDIIKAFDSVLLVNMFLNYENVFASGFDIGFGVYNLFNQNYSYITPYNAHHAAIPSASREFVIRFSFMINGK